MSRRRGTNARRLGATRLGKPFRGAFAGPYNAAAKLSIPVVGSGVSAMHPDVVDFGSAWNGGRYWMGFTPYNGTGDTEIPSVVVSSSLTSGGTWSVPSGYTNPVTADPVGSGHMADTDLVYDSSTGRLHILYITTDESTYQDVRSKYTTGSGTWSTETTVLAGALDAYTNPSVVKVGSNWRMYYNDDLGALDGLYYRESSTSPVSGYGSATTCTLSLNFGLQQRKMQNINAIKDTDGTVVIVCSDGMSDGLMGTLMFARSTDGGTTFTLTGPPVIDIDGPTTKWDSGGIYRASVLVDTTGTVVVDSGMIHVWYSAYQYGGVTNWGTGYCQLPVECIRF